MILKAHNRPYGQRAGFFFFDCEPGSIARDGVSTDALGEDIGETGGRGETRSS